MDTRVSLQTIVQNALADTRRLTDQITDLQSQSASGKKFANVSDDPATVLTVLGQDTLAANYGTHLDNITSATSKLNASVSTLQDVSNLFTQARSVAIEGSSSINDSTSFESLAQSVDAMIDRLLNLANTKSDGVYTYGGTATRSQPFVVSSADSQGRPLAVSYQGATDATSVFVDRVQQIAQEYAGDQVFQGRDRQATVFTGATGAQPGGGTDTATGRDQLLIQHTATTYAAGSGVQPGASSATSDTILGPMGAHKLHITDTSGTGASGTITLDGGSSFNFTNADTNLRITNNNGDVVFVDMSAITANFDGDVNIAGAGAMSIDGGATTTPITFAGNQSVTDSVTGKVTFVDTTNVLRTGTEEVNYPGTFDAFQALIALRDDLRNTRQLSEHDQIQAISADMNELDRVHTHILGVVGTQSATLQNLESLQSHLQDLQLNAKKTSSELGDADLSDLVIKLQSYQNMLQLSYASFARIIDQNILDFLK
jgi:flagellar hook-associated protein 3